MVPTSRSARMMARSLFSEEDMTFAIWASKALRSFGSSGVNAAMRTDSGSRICSKIASRSPTSTGRSATCDMRTVLLVLALVVRRGVDLVKRCSSAPHLLDDLFGGLAPDEGLGIVVPVLGPQLYRLSRRLDAREHAVAEGTAAARDTIPK